MPSFFKKLKAKCRRVLRRQKQSRYQQEIESPLQEQRNSASSETFLEEDDLETIAISQGLVARRKPVVFTTTNPFPPEHTAVIEEIESNVAVASIIRITENSTIAFTDEPTEDARETRESQDEFDDDELPTDGYDEDYTGRDRNTQRLLELVQSYEAEDDDFYGEDDDEFGSDYDGFEPEPVDQYYVGEAYLANGYSNGIYLPRATVNPPVVEIMVQT